MSTFVKPGADTGDPVTGACDSVALEAHEPHADEPSPLASSEPGPVAEAMARRIVEVAESHGLRIPFDRAYSLSSVVLQRQRIYVAWSRSLKRLTPKNSLDILNLIVLAQRDGDQEEALWRSFLAAHFGRVSASPQQVNSAGSFLCGLEDGAQPVWAWQRVQSDFGALSRWLSAGQDRLRTLRFGNHRKYESNRPGPLEAVLSSFVDWAQSYGGPRAAFSVQDGTSPRDGFHALYERFAVTRFGRTGRFDFLCLLGDLGLEPIEPDSCYIIGSTGPLQGMKNLCGDVSVPTLAALADELARQLGVSPRVMEDALCIWQKRSS